MRRLKLMAYPHSHGSETPWLQFIVVTYFLLSDHLGCNSPKFSNIISSNSFPMASLK